MKITVLGKKIVAFFAIALLGFSLAGCLEESGGDDFRKSSRKC